jgi:hypothetical protein
LGALTVAAPAFMLPVWQAIWSFLCRRSFWQLTTMGLAFCLLVDHLALLGAHRQAAKYDSRIAALTAQIEAISAKKDTQKIVTRTRIQTVTKTIHDKELIAQKIEQAAPAPDCHTNSAVLGADL